MYSYKSILLFCENVETLVTLVDEMEAEEITIDEKHCDSTGSGKEF